VDSGSLDFLTTSDNRIEDSISIPAGPARRIRISVAAARVRPGRKRNNNTKNERDQAA